MYFVLYWDRLGSSVLTNNPQISVTGSRTSLFLTGVTFSARLFVDGVAHGFQAGECSPSSDAGISA